MIEIREIILSLDQFEGEKEKLYSKLEKLGAVGEDKVQECFQQLLLDYRANPVILSILITYLQTTKDERVLANVSLSDIEILFEKCVKIFKTDFDFYIEYSFFLFSTMDNDEKALYFISEIKKKFDSAYAKFYKYYTDNK